MRKLDLKKETRLESAPFQEVEAILDHKLEDVGAEGVADYIGISLQNLGDRLERIKEAEAHLKSLKSELNEQVDTIKVGSAKWLQDAGIDKLSGLYVSSISVSKSKPKEDLKIINEDELINQGYFKTTVDKTAVKRAILDDVKVDGASIEITHVEDKVRVNMRKKEIAS